MTIIERSADNVDQVELPEPGLWNVPAGWALIELSVPRMFRRPIEAHLRMKQGMIAIADDPTHSTSNLSLDACTLGTGSPALD